nr:uncharacterized protein LOC112002044 [Quercus suber]XP_023889984.1 uncharacterized protein LOC112002045 [Quercus suber]
MRDEETLKAYSDKYWEIYNELDDKYDDVAINTFKNGLLMGHGLRKSLTGKPATSVRQLMDRIDKYKQDHGHATEDCRNLWNYLDQLVREGKLKHLLHHSSNHQGQTYQEPRRDTAKRQPASMINLILAEPRRTGTHPSRVLSVTQVPAKESQSESKKARRGFHPTLSFFKEDKDGTTQPHDDVLVITLRIWDYDVKRVMVDGGSAAEVMYPDLYKGLGLKPEDLTPYSSPLMSFDGKLIISKGMIRLPIQTGLKVVEVNFIVVDTYSPLLCHYRKALAPHLGGRCLFLAPEGEIPIRGPSPRDLGLLVCGKAVYGGSHYMSARFRVLSRCGPKLIAIKDLSGAN